MSIKKDQVLTNFPGLEYLTRVSTAWNEFLLGQAGATQDIWDEIKNGGFKLERIAQAWANGMDGYYDVAREAARSNLDAARPAWLHVLFSKAAPSTLEHPLTLGRMQPDDTQPIGSEFFNMAAREKGRELYSSDGLSLKGGRNLLVKLDTKKVKVVAAGSYMSLIYAPGRSAGPPLAVVVLTVTP